MHQKHQPGPLRVAPWLVSNPSGPTAKKPPVMARHYALLSWTRAFRTARSKKRSSRLPPLVRVSGIYTGGRTMVNRLRLADDAVNFEKCVLPQENVCGVLSNIEGRWALPAYSSKTAARYRRPFWLQFVNARGYSAASVAGRRRRRAGPEAASSGPGRTPPLACSLAISSSRLAAILRN